MTDAGFAARKEAQGHFRTPLVNSPFQPRLDALMRRADWYGWAGMRAPKVFHEEEMEFSAIRTQAALFDLSPMVKYRIEGPEAETFCDRLALRDVTKLAVGRVHYTAWCDEDGHVLDDGTLFRLAADRFRLCCQERHLPWLLDSALGFDVTIAEETEEIAALAVQGPTAFAVLRDAGLAGVEALRVFDVGRFTAGGVAVTVSRTGFTGDLGYELFAAAADALPLWDRLMEAGRLHGLRPIGYAALDRARIEAGLIVAGTDFVPAGLALRLDRARRPDEIGLGFMVDAGKKAAFNGRAAILSARAGRTLRHVLVGLEIDGNIAAEHAVVYHRGRGEAGLATSACWSPTAKKSIAIASLVRPYGEKVLDDLSVEIYALRELGHEKLMRRARVVPRPFVKLARRAAWPPAER